MTEDMPTINHEGTLDLRPAMEFEVVYRRLDKATCSYCTEPGEFLTKHVWGHRDLGQLVTRCFGHQAAFEQTQRHALGRAMFTQQRGLSIHSVTGDPVLNN